MSSTLRSSSRYMRRERSREIGLVNSYREEEETRRPRQPGTARVHEAQRARHYSIGVCDPATMCTLRAWRAAVAICEHVISSVLREDEEKGWALSPIELFS